MRRSVLLGGLGLSGAAYAGWAEPSMRLTVAAHRPILPEWRGRAPLRIVILSDIHAGEPVMPALRVAEIVRQANALDPDLTLVLGDLGSQARFVTRAVPLASFAGLLGRLRAPLGVHAVLGNHDWWDDPMANRLRPPATVAALGAVGIGVLRNGAVRLRDGSDGFWLAGLDSQLAFGRRGADDVGRTLAAITDDAPAILMAHEPDVFARATPRFALQVSGHTHGGQLRLAGWSPRVPSAFGNRYAYGLVREEGRSLVVSGGLGCSGLPVRFGVPPEITLVEVA
ncbi:metallophosphoesterase [Humitalea sp. 24SJ18S-53]|uniref:metallophosphoesterase n=1 Tax=Humitalea sp. 24SJ18S-53 TaxID=3422307 RepID=UPI003D6710E8